MPNGCRRAIIRHSRPGVSGRPERRPGARCSATRFLCVVQRRRQRLHRAADVSDGRRCQRDHHRVPGRWRDGDNPCRDRVMRT